MSSRRADGHRLEFLPEAVDNANCLGIELRRVIGRIALDLHENPWLGELMDDRWPRNLEGCRKLRFDLPGREGKPRYRLVSGNEPSDGVGVTVVLAIEEQRRMIAYARASARLARQLGRESRGAR